MATQASSKISFAERFERYQPSKSMLGWTCVAAVAATLVIGFGWGGWVTGGTAQRTATAAADVARGDVASAICVERFNAAPDAAAQLVAFKALTEGFKKRQFIEAGGWATMPGQTIPDRRGVDGCITALAV